MTKIGAEHFAALFDMDAQSLHQAMSVDQLPIIGGDDLLGNFILRQQFSYDEALMVEVARQIHDDGGLPLAVASNIVWNGIDFADMRATPDDYWVAVIRSRNTWDDSVQRGSWPVTLIGVGEYWSSAYFAGSLSHVQNKLSGYINQSRETDSDPARILITNVSAADRRLRRRAAAKGIAVINSEFA